MSRSKVSILTEVEGVTKDTISELETEIVDCEFDTIITHTGVKAVKGLRKYSVEEMLELEDPYRGKGIGVFQEDAVYIFCQYDDEDRTIMREEIQEEEESKKKEGSVSESTYSSKEGVTSLLEGSAIYKKLCKPVSNFKELTLGVETDQKLQREYFDIPIKGICKHITFIHSNTSTEIGWYNLRANILWLSDVAHSITSFPKLLKGILIKVNELRKYGKFKETPIQMGADPEFEILSSDDQLLSANLFFKFEGQIGTDGHCDTGEIRPDPARNPLELVNNIKRLIRRLSKTSSLPIDSKICAGGGTKVTTGGHIHFGMDKIPDNAKDILYDLVGKHLLAHQTGIRNNSKELVTKGGSDSIRGSDSHRGWEWRSPPSWLTSESIATCVLVTTYCVVSAISTSLLTVEGQKKAILRSLPLYPVYKEYIEDFISKFYSTTKQIQLEGIHIIPEWNLKLSSGTQNIKIISTNLMVQKFFAPRLYPFRKNNRNITIEIEFGGMRIASYGLTKLTESKLEKMANAYLFDYIAFSSFKEAIDYACDNSASMISGSRGKIADANILIILPSAWADFPRKKTLFKRLGTLIKDTIISLDV